MSLTAEQSDSLRSLITQLSDGSLDTDGWAQLDALLAESSAAQDIYLDHLTHEALLHREYAKSIATPIRPASSARDDSFRVAPFVWSVAAAFVVGAAAVSIYLLGMNPPLGADAPVSPGPPVATVIDTSGTLLVNDDIAVPGSDYAKGDYAIESGYAEIQLTSGANVQISGRAKITLRSDMNAVLDHGIAAFNCPPSAHGFTVTMPDGSRVVDLGTSFSIDARGDGSAAIWVTSGRVRVERDDTPPRVLTSGRLHTRTAEGLWRSDDAPYPLAVTDGLALRLVADSDLELDDAGGVIRWGGSDGLLAARQDDPTKRPRLIPGAIAGLPAIRFDGDLLNVDAFERSTDLTVLAVIRPTQQPEPEGQVFHAGPAPVLVLSLGDSWCARMYTGSRENQPRAAGPAATLGQPVVAGLIHDASSGRLSLILGDRRRDVETHPRQASGDVVSTIGSHASGVSSFIGDIAELIVFTRALETNEIDAIRTQLYERYGRAVSKPTE